MTAGPRIGRPVPQSGAPLLIVFAATSTVLGLAGVFGVVSVALGADSGAVERLVLGKSLAPALAGSITRLMLAALGARISMPSSSALRRTMRASMRPRRCSSWLSQW